MDFEKVETALRTNYPIGYILRGDLTRATGGILKSTSISVRDCEGTGIPSIKMGRKVAYKIEDVIDYLKKKVN